MKDERGAGAWEWLAALVCGALFVLIRWPLYHAPGLLLGWNSDAALSGLMARAIASGTDHPVFFWGQRYHGTFSPHATAALALLRSEAIGPLLLRIESALEIVIGTLCYCAALRRTFGREATVLAAVWLAAGPVFLFHMTIAPSSQQLYFIGGLLFWYAMRAHATSGSEWLVTGLICGIGLWMHQFLIFLIVPIGIAIYLEQRTIRWRWIALLGTGTLIGYSASFVDLLRGDPILYRRAIPHWTFDRVAGNMREIVEIDTWLMLGDESWLGITAGVLLLAFTAAGLRRAKPSRGVTIAMLTIACSFAFRLWSTYSYPGALRYVAPALPMIYAAAAYGIVTCWRESGPRRAFAAAAALLIAVGLYVPRLGDVRDVVAARSERYTNWPSDFDPRPTLATLRAGGYRVCYGEVWVAHKLEWLTEPTVRFVPVRSVHRTLPLSLQLVREPGVKCFVDNDGNVRRLSAEEDAYWRSTVLRRAQRAGLLLRE